MNGIGTQLIETKRLILRKVEVKDYESIYKNWTSDKLVARYVSWNVHESLDVTKQYCEYKANRYDGHEYCFDWVVELKETNELIGEIEAINVSKAARLVELGYCFGSKYWNKGYATEALTAFIDYMFNKVDVDKIIACHISTNPASGRVMQKCGMQYDATLKGYFVDKNTNLRADKVCYSIDNKRLI